MRHRKSPLTPALTNAMQAPLDQDISDLNGKAKIVATPEAKAYRDKLEKKGHLTIPWAFGMGQKKKGRVRSKDAATPEPPEPPTEEELEEAAEPSPLHFVSIEEVAAAVAQLPAAVNMVRERRVALWKQANPEHAEDASKGVGPTDERKAKSPHGWRTKNMPGGQVLSEPSTFMDTYGRYMSDAQREAANLFLDAHERSEKMHSARINSKVYTGAVGSRGGGNGAEWMTIKEEDEAALFQSAYESMTRYSMVFWSILEDTVLGKAPLGGDAPLTVREIARKYSGGRYTGADTAPPFVFGITGLALVKWLEGLADALRVRQRARETGAIKTRSDWQGVIKAEASTLARDKGDRELAAMRQSQAKRQEKG